MTADTDEANNKQMELEKRLAAMEAALKQSNNALQAEKGAREEQDKMMKYQRESQIRQEEDQRRLRFKMLESEDKMRRQIEQKERMLRAEREEKETTMAMLRAKQDELDRYVSSTSLFSSYLQKYYSMQPRKYVITKNTTVTYYFFVCKLRGFWYFNLPFNL